MPSTQASSSSAPAIDNVSDEDYKAVVDEIEELMDEVSETGLLLKILEAYKKVDMETVDFYLACHPFGGVIKGALRKLYTNCHQRWNHKNGKNEGLVMPYPIREGKVDKEEKKNYVLKKLKFYKLKDPSFKINFDALEMVTGMKKYEIEECLSIRKERTWHSKCSTYKPTVCTFHLKYHKHVKKTTIEFMLSMPKKLEKLLKMLMDDETFEDYMEQAYEYTANINKTEPDEAIKECEVLLKFLVLVRRGEAFEMFDLVKNNQFILSNQQGMRRLYRKGYRKFVTDNNLWTKKSDPAPYPINIMFKKPATEEENKIIEDELRKMLDNPKYRCDYVETAKRTNKSYEAVVTFLRRRTDREKALSRAEQDIFRKKRLEKLRKRAIDEKTLRKRFRLRNLEFFEAHERKMGILIEQDSKRIRVRGPRKTAEKRPARAKSVKQRRIKSKEIVESSESETEEESSDDDNSENEELTRKTEESDTSGSETEEHNDNEMESRGSSRQSNKSDTTKRRGKTSKPVVKRDEWDSDRKDSTSDDSSSEDDSTDDECSSQRDDEPSTSAVQPAAEHRGRSKKQVAEKLAKPIVPAVGRRGRSGKQELVEPLSMAGRRGRARMQEVKPAEQVLDEDNMAKKKNARNMRASADVHYDLPDYQSYSMETGSAGPSQRLQRLELREPSYQHSVPSVEDEPVLDSAMPPFVEHVAVNQFMDYDAEQNVEQDAFVDNEQPIEQEEKEHEVAQQNQVEQEGDMMNPEVPAQLPEIANNEKPKIIIPRAKTVEYREWLKTFIEVGEAFDSLSNAHVEMTRPIKEEVGEGIQVIVQSEPNPMRREITSLLDLITAEEEMEVSNVPGPSRKRLHNQEDERVGKRARTGEPEEREVKQEVADDSYEQQEVGQAEPPVEHDRVPVNQVAAVVAPVEPLLVVPKEEVEDV